MLPVCFIIALVLCHYSSKNSSDQLTACCFQLRRGNDNPYWMDYQECCHSLTILYFLCLRIGSYLSTRGLTSLAVALLRSSDQLITEPANTIELNMCSHERILDIEHHVKYREKTVIQRYKTLEDARFWKTSFYTTHSENDDIVSLSKSQSSRGQGGDRGKPATITYEDVLSGVRHFLWITSQKNGMCAMPLPVTRCQRSMCYVCFFVSSHPRPV